MKITAEIEKAIAVDTLNQQDMYIAIHNEVPEIRMKTDQTSAEYVIQALSTFDIPRHDYRYDREVNESISEDLAAGRGSIVVNGVLQHEKGDVFINVMGENSLTKLAEAGVEFPGRDAMFPELAQEKGAFVERTGRGGRS